jgi:hypothetical protein
MKDGPHVRLIDTLSAEVYFLVHDSFSGQSHITRDTVLFSEMPAMVNGVLIDPSDFGVGAVSHETSH